MKQILIAILMLKVFNQGNAQKKGLIIDSITNEQLAYPHEIINDSQDGTLTDIDGKFNIASKNVRSITISYIGYKEKTIRLNGSQYIKVPLEASSELLKEVIVYEGENPALRIIRNSIENKSQNNPENLPFFSLETYCSIVSIF